MKQCRYCNTKNDDLFLVCIKCGKPFDEDNQESNNENNMSLFSFFMNNSPMVWKIKIKYDILRLKQGITKNIPKIKSNSSNLKICPNCNNANSSSSKYCSNCGYFFVSNSSEQNNVYLPKTNKRKVISVISFIIIAFVLILIIGNKSDKNIELNSEYETTAYEETTEYRTTTRSLSSEDRAVIALYSQLNNLSSSGDYDLKSTKYKINTSERGASYGSGYTIFYGKVYLYDNYGNYKRDMNFEVRVYDDQSIDSYCTFQ